jgi:Ca2+/H+ antiporter, TMEM165/GDT1 family
VATPEFFWYKSSMGAELFFSTLLLIFIAELPDKTALATVLMATRERPLAIFLGAALAFVVQTVVAVFFGQFLNLLPVKYVHWFSAVLFIVFAVMAWRRRDSGHEGGEAKAASTFWQSAFKAFMVIFIAEWGDLTQLATATLVAKFGQPLLIFTASVLALWAATAVAIFVGRAAKSFIDVKVLNRVAAILFFGIGIYFLFV